MSSETKRLSTQSQSRAPKLRLLQRVADPDEKEAQAMYDSSFENPKELGTTRYFFLLSARISVSSLHIVRVIKTQQKDDFEVMNRGGVKCDCGGYYSAGHDDTCPFIAWLKNDTLVIFF